MSKQNKQNTQNTQTVSTPAPAPEPPAAPEPSSELAVAEDRTSEVVPVHALTQRYKESLPQLEQYLDQVLPPAPGEIKTALTTLSPEKRAAFTAALARMNPIKAGQHTARTEFRLPEMRVYQGTGADELRPADCPTGGIYTTDGRVLAAPKAALVNLRHNPKHAKLGTTVSGYVIGVHEAHTFWPPRSGNNPPGIEVRANVPICRSLDRQRGDGFGACAACSYRPFKDGKPVKGGKANKDGCRNEDHVYFVPADFSGVYRLVVHGKGIGPGSAAIKKKTRPWTSYYEHAFELEAKEITEGTDRWFELNASVASDTPDPNEAEAALLSALQRQVDYEVYLPQMHAIYTSEPKYANTAASGSDMDELLKNAGGAPAGATGSKDVSKSM